MGEERSDNEMIDNDSACTKAKIHGGKKRGEQEQEQEKE